MIKYLTTVGGTVGRGLSWASFRGRVFYFVSMSMSIVRLVIWGAGGI